MTATAQTFDDISALARATDPDTSRQAARNATVNANTNRALALRILRDNPDGLTDFELAALSGVQQTSIGKRRGELVALNLVVKTSQRRPSPSGSPSIVWRPIVAPHAEAS